MKLKILIVTGKLQSYRIPIFNEIVKKGIDLTVAHSYKLLDDGTFLFKEVLLEEKTIGPFSYHKKNLKKFCSNFDIVIATFYLQKLSFMSLLCGNRKFKLAYWGIGVKASQNHRFDTPTFLNYIRYFIAKKSDAMIFYTEYAKLKYLNRGIAKEKLFVMNNTVYVNPELVKSENAKSSMLLIGTLNKSKKVFELVEAYKRVLFKYPDLQILEIIGGGEDFDELVKWIAKHEVSKNIILHGPIYNEEEKATILNRSICAISPDQSGLSVLETMGYGIPFITHKDSITGGERLNINEERGVLFDDFKDLEEILEDIYHNPNKYLLKGESSRLYYNENRTVDNIVDEFFDLVSFLK